MQDFLFYFFSALTLVGAFSVVISRSAVTGVMSMIVSFIGMSGLFLLLEAFLLAILQVFVYAGAVMVLFLFVVMLLNLEDSGRKGPDGLTVAMSTLGAGLLASLFAYLFIFSPYAIDLALPLATVGDLPTFDNPSAFCTSAKAFGFSLFSKYLLPVQVAGFLLLLSIVGVVYLAKSLNKNSHDA